MKRDHYYYVLKIFDNGEREMWCHCARLPAMNMRSEYFLGSILEDKRWIESKHSRKLDWSMQKHSKELYAKVLKSLEINKDMVYPKPKKENRIWTREDFVNFGKKGQQKVRDKYGKPPVSLKKKA